MKNRKFIIIGLVCLAVAIFFAVSAGALNFSINRALTNEAEKVGTDWSKHIVHHTPNVRNREQAGDFDAIQAALRTENLARLATDIVKTSDVFQIDFVNSDCYCSISLGSYLAKTKTPHRDITVNYSNLTPPKNHKIDVFKKRATKLPSHYSYAMMKHVFLSKRSHEPKQLRGNGLHQTRLDWKKSANAIKTKEIKTYLQQGDGKHTPGTYAEVFYPVTVKGNAVYMIRTLVNLEASASDYTFYHYGGFILMLVLLAATFAVPAYNYWVTRKISTQNEERAAYFETYDPLTEAMNRNAMHKTAQEILQNSDNNNQNWVLTLIELRNLAEINDISSHKFGDSVLQEFAAILEAQCGKKSIVARISGATFAVLMPRRRFDQMRKTFMTKLNRGYQMKIENRSVLLELNSGSAHYPEHAHTFDSLLRDASLTLNQSKEIGANIHRIFIPKLASEHRARAALRRSFKNAILTQQIMPYYQPIINAETGQLVGLEALARWMHPAKGVLTPASFYTALEDPEISALLGKEMIRLVTGHMGNWKADNLPFNYVGVNINAGDLDREGFVLETAKAIADNGLYGPNLSLEVSENCIFGDKKDEYFQKLTLLKDAGCRIALDDFGTGYSSISQLKQVPFDTVKIDRSFISEIDQSENDRAIVKALTDLSRSMKFKLIAEGVETDEQLETTKELGVSLIQGFLFAEPMPMSEVPSFIKTTQRSAIPVKMAS